jgi:hypothetical protein
MSLREDAELRRLKVQLHEQQQDLDTIRIARAFGVPVASLETPAHRTRSRHGFMGERWYEVSRRGELLYLGTSLGLARTFQRRHGGWLTETEGPNA